MSTPLEVVANVSRIVTKVCDRISGSRVDYPLLVATAAQEALKQHGIQSQVMYGPAAWIEVLENHAVTWAGCWGEFFHFWVATEFGEVVDLNVAVAHQKRSHQTPQVKPLYSPPNLWSAQVPRFYRYIPDGIAEVELTEERDQRWFKLVLEEVRAKCGPTQIAGKEPEFPNEPLLCPDRRVLDDSHETFRHFDRALSVLGIPAAPI